MQEQREVAPCCHLPRQCHTLGSPSGSLCCQSLQSGPQDLALVKQKLIGEAKTQKCLTVATNWNDHGLLPEHFLGIVADHGHGGGKRNFRFSRGDDELDESEQLATQLGCLRPREE